MKLSEFRQLVRNIVKEETKYQQFFRKMLDKAGVKSPADFKTDDEKKSFFDKVDAAWNANKETDVDENVGKLREYIRSLMSEETTITEGLESHLKEAFDGFRIVFGKNAYFTRGYFVMGKSSTGEYLVAKIVALGDPMFVYTKTKIPVEG